MLKEQIALDRLMFERAHDSWRTPELIIIETVRFTSIINELEQSTNLIFDQSSKNYRYRGIRVIRSSDLLPGEIIVK